MTWITAQKLWVSYPNRIRPNMGSYVMANVPKRRVVVVHPSVSETLIDGPAASGAVHSDGSTNGGETTQSRKPWPAEFGWDFPFDFPKPGR